MLQGERRSDVLERALRALGLYHHGHVGKGRDSLLTLSQVGKGTLRRPLGKLDTCSLEIRQGNDLVSDTHLKNLKQDVEPWLMGQRRKREARLCWRLATLPPTKQSELEASFPMVHKDREITGLKLPSKGIYPRRVLERQ